MADKIYKQQKDERNRLITIKIFYNTRGYCWQAEELDSGMIYGSCTQYPTRRQALKAAEDSLKS